MEVQLDTAHCLDCLCWTLANSVYLPAPWEQRPDRISLFGRESLLCVCLFPKTQNGILYTANLHPGREIAGVPHSILQPIFFSCVHQKEGYFLLLPWKNLSASSLVLCNPFSWLQSHCSGAFSPPSLCRSSLNHSQSSFTKAAFDSPPKGFLGPFPSLWATGIPWVQPCLGLPRSPIFHSILKSIISCLNHSSEPLGLCVLPMVISLMKEFVFFISVVGIVFYFCILKWSF